jgi:hypothetical protein
MSMPLLTASILVGILVTCVGIYRAYKQGEFMPLVLGMLRQTAYQRGRRGRSIHR